MPRAPTRLSRVSIPAIAIAAVALPAAPASAAGFMYFKDSPIVGEAADGRQVGRIPVDSWSWGDTRARGGEKWFVADSFSFGVEREMKESGETGGTEDINIGVGEVQEATISKRKDMSSPQLAQGTARNRPMGWDNTKQTQFDGRAGPRARGSLSVKVPAGTCKAGKRYSAAEFGTDRRVYQLSGVVVTGCQSARDGSIPTETLSLNYDKIVWK